MDSFFGIGTPELLVILILAGIVMGPQRIAGFARWLGKTTAYLQTISRGFAMQLKQELDQIDEGGDMQDMMNEMRNLQQEVNNLRQQVQDTATSAVSQTEKLVKESQEAVEQSIRPPKLGDDKKETKTDQAGANGSSPLPPPSLSPENLPNIVEVPDDPD